MKPDELEAKAKALYDSNDNRASIPDWEQLGGVTQTVWKERVLSGQLPLPRKPKPGITIIRRKVI